LATPNRWDLNEDGYGYVFTDFDYTVSDPNLAVAYLTFQVASPGIPMIFTNLGLSLGIKIS